MQKEKQFTEKDKKTPKHSREVIGTFILICFTVQLKLSPVKISYYSATFAGSSASALGASASALGALALGASA